jgi:polysaccharide biosynthesis transport protein
MDLLLLAKALWRKLWIILSVPLIAAFAAYLFTMNMKPEYKANAQIATGFTLNDQVQITEDKFNMRDADVKFNNLLSSMNSGLATNLTSYRLLLHDLNPNEVPFHRPDPATFSGSAKEAELVRTMVKRKLDSLSPLSTSDPDFPLIRKYLEAYGYGYNNIKDKLWIERIPNTDFIDVWFGSEKPKLSAYAANAFCEEFIRYHQSLKTERTGESVDYLKKIADTKKQELDAKLELQKQFKMGNHIYNEGESGIMIGQLSELQNQQDEIRANMHRMELTIQRINADIRRIGAPVQMNNNQKILELREKIDKLNDRYITGGSTSQVLLDSLKMLRNELVVQTDYSNRLGSSVPQGYTVADLQIKLKDAEIEYEYEKNKLSLINAKIAGLQYSLAGSSSKEARLSAIQKEIDFATKEYEDANEKYSSAASKLVGSGGVRQVLVAIPPMNPENSTRLIIVGLAAFTSLALCVFAIVAIELLDSSIRTPDRFKRMVGLPLLGALNCIDSRNFNIRTYFNQQNGSEETEMFKSLLRKFRHEIESLNGKVILFTSPRSRDGKTFVMFSLAYVLSLLDKRVLIVDTNFKNNSLSQILGRGQGSDLKVLDAKKNKLLASAQGETTPKEHQEFEHENSYDLINPTKYKNIYLVGNSGGGHESPAEILSGRDFSHLVSLLAENFDYVLLEGAALNDYSDTKELVKFSDKVVAVYSAENNIKQMDRESIQYFKSLGKKFGGALLNKVDAKDLKL